MHSFQNKNEYFHNNLIYCHLLTNAETKTEIIFIYMGKYVFNLVVLLVLFVT